ncbi:hypothetical protein BAE44_0024697 [Dichanthelium oligosanthes]|uniref:Uncharacterized protein n=1 Tax=Dichanthelium oligosanthes TaxID=888268 RepID=A0A1E5UN27_9POAL|nr:hypothetical protein BAE44_0024697 [Dichanthelium oligosanthes]
MALARLGQSFARRLHRPLYLPPPPFPPLADRHAAVVRSFAPADTGACLRGDRVIACFIACFASLAYNASSVIGHKLGGPSPLHVVLDLVIHLNHGRPMSTAAPAAAPPPLPSPSASKVPVGARKVGLKVVMMSPGFVYEPYSPRERIPFWKRWFTLSGWRRTKEDIILEVNTLMAHGDTSSLRKILTERMHSVGFQHFINPC